VPARSAERSGDDGREPTVVAVAPGVSPNRLDDVESEEQRLGGGVPKAWFDHTSSPAVSIPDAEE